MQAQKQGFKLKALLYPFHNQSLKPDGAFNLGSSLHRPTEAELPRRLGVVAQTQKTWRFKLKALLTVYPFIYQNFETGVVLSSQGDALHLRPALVMFTLPSPIVALVTPAL